MSLLQIAEPESATESIEKRYAIGIDLGTTNSLVAVINQETQTPYSLPDEAGSIKTPSVVQYCPNNCVIAGQQAKEAQHCDPMNTIVSAKRFIGRKLVDIYKPEQLPYKLIDAPGMLAFQTCSGMKSPVEASAEILKALKNRAIDAFGEENFAGAVITVPAYFDDAQRQATKDAAKLAGLNVLRLLNEPTSAAIAYGLDNGSEGIYAVYDLGGGTFDLSILRLSKGVFQVIATGGDSALGGDDYDQQLAQWFIQKQNIRVETPRSKRAILMAAKQVKEMLSQQETADFIFQQSEMTYSQVISREEFAEITKNITEKTLSLTEQVIQDADVSASEIQGIILVGGSTRMPVIRQALEQRIGCPPLTNLNPDEVVALGAAIQANALAGNRTEDSVLLLDVLPLSLGIETMGGLVERIIQRNSPIPTARAQKFTTFKDGQTAMSLHVVQGERDLVSECRSLASFTLSGIPPMNAGVARIQVTLTVDADGLLTVQAQEQTSGVEAHIEIKPSYGLSNEEVIRMLTDGFDHAESDMHARSLREAVVLAKRTIQTLEGALEADSDLLSERELQDIQTLIKASQATYESNDLTLIEGATEALIKGTELFAEKRMTRSIQKVLTGKTIEEV